MPMRAGEARLAIDCGTTSTVAVLAWPDGSWSPLSFDGAPHLSSAVYLSPDGDVWTGQRAWQAAADQPNRFIPAPRRPTDDQLTIDGTVVDALDLAAATLRRVAAEAERVAGGPVQDVRVVVPAGWGPRRRTWMRQAAHRAGLPQPRLVEAPVAVAEHLVATGLQCRVGSFIAVCDLGAGAEATVLRRGPAGFEVLATLADPAAGGTAIDQALAASLTGDPMPEDAGDGALRWTVAASVQAAKEALAHHPAVTVPLPNRPPIIVNNTMLEQAAHPVLQRAAQLTSEAVTAAEISTRRTRRRLLRRRRRAPAATGEAHRRPDRRRSDSGHAAGARCRQRRRGRRRRQPQHGERRGSAGAAGAAGRRHRRARLRVPGPDLAVPHDRRAAQHAERALLGDPELGRAHHGRRVRPPGMPRSGHHPRLPRRRPQPHPHTRSEGGKISVGILAAVSLGLAIAGLYAVVASQYLGQPVGAFLRWALWPITPTALMAAAMAVVAARQWRAPHGGWSALLAVPTGSVVTAAAGMALIQYSLTADRWPDLILWIDIAGRVGGLLLGVGVVMALVTPLVFRLILAAPLAVITAAIVSSQAAGILGVIYAIAIAVWWAARLWTRVIRPAAPAAHAP